MPEIFRCYRKPFAFFSWKQKPLHIHVTGNEGNTCPLKIKTKRSLLLILLVQLSLSLCAQSDAQAKKIFDQTMALIQHSGGAQMEYRLKVTRLFTQTGRATLKGNKTLTETKGGKVWFNGRTGWWLDLKKNTVTLFGPNYKRHISMEKQLRIAKTNCTYTMTEQKDGYLIHLKTKDHNVDIREATALVDKTTYAPLQLRFKWKIFWFAIDMWNFHTGTFDDALFEYNEKDYPGVKVVDKRKDG